MAKIKQFEAFTKMCVAYKKTGCSYYSTDKKSLGQSDIWFLSYFQIQSKNGPWENIGVFGRRRPILPEYVFQNN